MRFCILLLSFFIFIAASPAHAAERVEDIAAQIKQNLQSGSFKKAEDIFEHHKTANTMTRHGTDMALHLMDNIIQSIEGTATFGKWLEIGEQWTINSPNSLIAKIFLQRVKFDQAWYKQNSVEWENIKQSQRRKYKTTLRSGYEVLYQLSKKHPDDWRIHAYLVENFVKYKLNANEVKEHYEAAKAMRPYETSSMKGYITSLSPYALGRDDDAISQGIEAVLKAHPDKNLSKPEYIDSQIKKEIEDEIFNYTILKMLNTARELVNSAPKDSAAPILTPTVYHTIYRDLQKYYNNNTEAIDRHPFSLSRREVRNEIQESYTLLQRRFPLSGQYMTEHLEMEMELEKYESAKAIIQKIYKNDPEYNPAKLQPMLCNYYSDLSSREKSKENRQRMFEACSSASDFQKSRIFFYRTAWAARQIKDYKTSNEYLVLALKQAPKNVTYLTDLCWNYKDLKDYSTALDYCDKALESDPEHPRAWLGKSHIYYYGFQNIKQSQNAASMYERYSKKKAQ
jgi:tetratricopeptide (TPR) repeat protein